MTTVPQTDEAPQPTPEQAVWTHAVLFLSDVTHRTFPPELQGRIERATALALDPAKVREDASGLWYVAGDKSGWYTVNGDCTCKDFPHAPGLWCKHRICVGMVLKARTLTNADVHFDPATFFGTPAPSAAPADAAESTEGIDPCFLTMIHGKPFIRYVGLLAMAHAQGLQQIDAQFISVTDTLALAKATITFADGRVFSEAGDSSPENVHFAVRPHFARMALTRAKSRALRDALGIQIAAVEEME